MVRSARCDAAVGGNLGDDGGRRRLVALDDEGGLVVVIDVAEVLVERFHARKRAGGSRAERKEAAGAVLNGPAGVLASKAGDDRVGGVHRDAERPARQPRGHREVHDAEAAEANLSEPAPSLDPPLRGGTEVDAALAGLPGADDAAQGTGIGDEGINELGRFA